MPDKIPQTVPVIALLVDIVHAALEAGLQVLGVVAEQVHDHGPAERGKDGPGVVADLVRSARLRDDGEAASRLHGQARERQHHARKHVDDDLLVHRRDLARARAPAKDKVAAYQTGEEGVEFA